MSELKQPSSSYLPQAEEKSADGEIFTVVFEKRCSLRKIRQGKWRI